MSNVLVSLTHGSIWSLKQVLAILDNGERTFDNGGDAVNQLCHCAFARGLARKQGSESWNFAEITPRLAATESVTLRRNGAKGKHSAESVDDVQGRRPGALFCRG